MPDLQFVPGPFDPIDHFHTFVGLGFLDVHVEMTVDPAQNVTTQIWAQSVGQINLPVRPGDVISGALCLDTKPPGTAHYFLTNETTFQRINFTVDTGFPPAVTINAGVTRSGAANIPPFNHPLARVGVVYFDEISAYTTSGSRSLTAGDAITMVDQNGKVIARPVRLNDFGSRPCMRGADRHTGSSWRASQKQLEDFPAAWLETTTANRGLAITASAGSNCWLPAFATPLQGIRGCRAFALGATETPRFSTVVSISQVRNDSAITGTSPRRAICYSKDFVNGFVAVSRSVATVGGSAAADGARPRQVARSVIAADGAAHQQGAPAQTPGRTISSAAIRPLETMR